MTRVLLIEDNVIAQIATQHMLKQLHCAVDAAGSGQQALKHVEQNAPYDILLVDIGLPDLSGFDLIKRFDQIRDQQIFPWIIALTAYTGQSEKTRCEAHGANQVLYKPAQVEIFQEILLQLNIMKNAARR